MLPLLLSALVACNTAAGEDFIVHNANDLVKLSTIVNLGASFKGETVYLENDIEFTKELSDAFEPIGKLRTKSFQGTFDGRGHKISGLTINTTTEYIGLFGNAQECTIRNVVVDRSCSMVNPGVEEDTLTYIGGIVGSLNAGETIPYFVENCVNMMNLIYKNAADALVDMGGIAGGLHTYVEGCVIKNCINYGQITFYIGGPMASLYMGGIVGEGGVMFQTGSTEIKDCINYGDITYDGPEITFSNFGGIIGYSGWVRMTNCTNYGKVSGKN